LSSRGRTVRFGRRLEQRRKQGRHYIRFIGFDPEDVSFGDHPIGFSAILLRGKSMAKARLKARQKAW